MRNLILIAICVLFFTSCSFYIDIMNVDSNIKKVELGMNKNEVIRIMGESYQRMGASVSEEGIYIETLGYRTNEAIFMLYFENDRLVEFHKDLIITTERILREKN